MSAILYPTAPERLNYQESAWTDPNGGRWLWRADKGRWHPFLLVDMDPAALNLKAPLASPTFTGTVAGITASMVGLGNVINTSDADKPVSTAQQAAINLKADLDDLPALTFDGKDPNLATARISGTLGPNIAGDFYYLGVADGIEIWSNGTSISPAVDDVQLRILVGEYARLALYEYAGPTEPPSYSGSWNKADYASTSPIDFEGSLVPDGTAGVATLLFVALEGAYLGQLCKTPSAWWKYNGQGWIEEVSDPADWMTAALIYAGGNPNYPQSLTLTGVTPAGVNGGLLVYCGMINGKPAWSSDGSQLAGIAYPYNTRVSSATNGTAWNIVLDTTYAAVNFTPAAAANTPENLAGWTVNVGSGQPVIVASSAAPPLPIATRLGQLCKTPTAWWQWNGDVWLENIDHLDLSLKANVDSQTHTGSHSFSGSNRPTSTGTPSIIYDTSLITQADAHYQNILNPLRSGQLDTRPLAQYYSESASAGYTLVTSNYTLEITATEATQNSFYNYKLSDSIFKEASNRWNYARGCEIFMIFEMQVPTLTGTRHQIAICNILPNGNIDTNGTVGVAIEIYNEGGFPKLRLLRRVAMSDTSAAVSASVLQLGATAKFSAMWLRLTVSGTVELRVAGAASFTTFPNRPAVAQLTLPAATYDLVPGSIFLTGLATSATATQNAGTVRFHKLHYHIDN